ncbi:Early nodulin-like protein [Musa troglodytarum]|uniref:Early nodulin-like protein n=1 Tax=Musa troglodytarum TaxID=320322 RepID=A0A9E7GEL7_9LILI|nr:Early nodulin-like protein [Musa troglodytarum]
MAAILRAVVAMATVAAISTFAMGANYDVGGPAGSWDLATNYTQWVSGKAFRVGDTLTFKYASSHDVLEVSSAAYSSCTTSNPISTGTGGNTVVTLNSTGSRYFICGTPGHCAGGMKLQIDVASRPRLLLLLLLHPARPLLLPRSPSALPPASSTPGSVPPPSAPTVSPPTPSGACLQAKAALGLGSGIVMLMLVAL